MRDPQHRPKAKRRDLAVAFLCGAFVAVMVGVSYAAVPLYSWFCRTTGFGGTTQVAKTIPTQQSDRSIRVRFDANVAAGLPWLFEPERNTIDVRLGQVVTVYYKVTNKAARVTSGQAGYNVSPPTVGIYFEKNRLSKIPLPYASNPAGAPNPAAGGGGAARDTRRDAAADNATPDQSGR